MKLFIEVYERKPAQTGATFLAKSFDSIKDCINAMKNLEIFHLVPICSFDSVKGGDQATSKFCVSMGGDRSFCTAQCPSGKTFDKVTNRMQANTWWCEKGIWAGTDRVPDCVGMFIRYLSLDITYLSCCG